MLKSIKIAFFFTATLTVLAWLMKGRLPGPGDIHPELLSEPVQSSTAAPPFSFTYKGKGCHVRPVAAYELNGLVVSHNDIESIADIYHDSTSVDTKDLCVVWGANLERPDYLRVDFRSGAFTCYYQYPPGVRFSRRDAGNNHLITDDPQVRDRIARVRIGDQVRIRGLLVDYQMDDWHEFWRKTSTNRRDDGCEVVFVESVEFLRRGTPGWYRVFRIASWTTLLLPLVYLVVLHRSVGGPSS